MTGLHHGTRRVREIVCPTTSWLACKFSPNKPHADLYPAAYQKLVPQILPTQPIDKPKLSLLLTGVKDDSNSAKLQWRGLRGREGKVRTKELEV